MSENATQCEAIASEDAIAESGDLGGATLSLTTASIDIHLSDGTEVNLSPEDFDTFAKAKYPDKLLDAAEAAIRDKRCSTSRVQRALQIGYNAAARIVETLETFGVVSPTDETGKRTVLVEAVPDRLLAAVMVSSAGTELFAPDTATHASVMAALNAPSAEGKVSADDTPSADGEPSGGAYGVAAGELRQFIERYERLEAEKKDIADAQKEVMAEAKGRGYDTKVMRVIIALRKRDKDDIAEEECVLEMYKSALGMA